MKRAYLLVYSNELGTREQVQGVLNEVPEVLTWRYDMPNSFYIVSEATAPALYEAIKRRLNNNGRMFITEIPDNRDSRQGWITKASWHLIKEKELPPKEPQPSV